MTLYIILSLEPLKKGNIQYLTRSLLRERKKKMSIFSLVTGKAGPSGFGSASTAEQVTDGIDASNLTAIVTGQTNCLFQIFWPFFLFSFLCIDHGVSCDQYISAFCFLDFLLCWQEIMLSLKISVSFDSQTAILSFCSLVEDNHSLTHCWFYGWWLRWLSIF